MIIQTIKNIMSYLQKDMTNIPNKNENIVTVELSLDAFNTINQYSFIDIILSDKNITPTLSCPEHMKDSFSIEVNKNILSLNYKEYNKNFAYKGQKIVLNLPSQKLKEINNYSIGNIITDSVVTEQIINNGVGSISVEKFLGDYIEATSIGEICIHQIYADNLDIQHSGTSDIIFKKGNINNIDLYLNSLGNFDSNQTVIKNAILQNQGTGNIKVNNILNNLDALLLSIGNINVTGPMKESATIVNNGVGNIKSQGFDGTKNLHIELSSLGNINVIGTVQKLTSTSHGIGNINLSQLTQKLAKKLSL